MPRRSTTFLLLRNMDHKTEELDKRNKIDTVYIDFQRVFDSVPHQRSLGTVDKNDLRGKAVNWIRDFLFCRKLRVVIDASLSKWATVGSGIPQCSVIGPVLFIMFINSMFNCFSSKMYLHADDAKFYRVVTNDGAAQL